jgi:hypothetical protein
LVIEVQARVVGAAVSDAVSHPLQDARVRLPTAETDHNS